MLILNKNKAEKHESKSTSPNSSVVALEAFENEKNKKPLTKFDIGSPMPLVDGARDEVAKKWMLSDIKDIKGDLDDLKSGPDSGITSGGQTMKSSTTKAEKKSEISASKKRK